MLRPGLGFVKMGGRIRGYGVGLGMAGLFLLSSLAYGETFRADFEERLPLLTWPPAEWAAGRISRVTEDAARGNYSMRMVREATDERCLSAYAWYRHLRPGEVLQISFLYKFKELEGKGGLSFTLRFNDESGILGSAGREVLPIPVVREWTLFEATVPVPPRAILCQLVMRLAGGSAVVLVDDLTVSPIPDRIVIPRTTLAPKIDGCLDEPAWREALPLSRFYLTLNAEPAPQQTQVLLTYDNQNLYLAFINFETHMDHLKASHKEFDSAVWRDDSSQLFIYFPFPRKHRGYQFIVNALGTRFDAKLFQRMPGDPIRSDREWDGEWEAAGQRYPDRWVAELRIPFATLGIEPAPPTVLRVNLARERWAGIKEESQWNQFRGSFHDVSRYATLRFEEERAVISRYREIAKVLTFQVERQDPQFEELLADEPGNYLVGSWMHGIHKAHFPEGVRAMYPEEVWKEWQEEFLRAVGRAGMFGPPLPWFGLPSWRFKGVPGPREMHEQYGMKFPYFLHSSATHARAIRLGARFHRGGRVDPASPASTEAARQMIENHFIEHETLREMRDLVVFVMGLDEPTNHPPSIFSRIKNPAIAPALAEAEAEIKRDFGFNRFGLYDAFAEKDAQSPFRRIAFWRWWNARLASEKAEQRAKLAQVLPGVPFKVTNQNTVAGLSFLDIALISQAGDKISCDPYPTSTRVIFGMPRAIYHTGFSMKMMADLSGEIQAGIMPQAFVYHGGKPTPGDMREWASQALKTGAEFFQWYTLGPAPLTMPEGFREKLRLNNLIGRMRRVKLPERTATAVLHSNYTAWGLGDNVAHASYSVYALLGEYLGSWFDFVSETSLRLGVHNLNDYCLVYVRLKYTDIDTINKLKDFVYNGGMLVILDPEALSFLIDGTVPQEAQQKLIGAELARRPALTRAIKTVPAENILPLFEVRHLVGGGEVVAYDIKSLPAEAKIIARYEDGLPAAFEHQVGEGTVIFFAALPFGHSEVAITPEGWGEFFRQLAERVGEPTGLPIWDFELPAQGYEIEIDLLITGG
ncbi:hypothetical protein LR013_02210 [candidate division NPL-UPA2 bacterium]|nr:hypothetical protein [candidate division NPL-UPA2 bacterium]